MKKVSDLELPDASGVKVFGKSGNIILGFYGYGLKKRVYVHCTNSLQEVHDFLKAASFHNYCNTYIKEQQKQ